MPPGAARATTALEDIAQAAPVIAEELADAPMLSAHLVLALTGLARRLDRLYAELGL